MINPVRSKKSKISADLPEASWTSNGMKKLFKFISSLVIITLVFFAVPKEALAAVTLDTKLNTNADNTVGPATANWSFTPTGIPTLITVHVSSARGGDISGITYGGQSMTLVIAKDDGVPNRKARIWKLESPPSGTQTVEITMDGNVAYVIETIAWTGTATTGATSGPQSSGGNAGNTSTPAVTSATGDVVIDTLVLDGCGTAITDGANQTEQWDVDGANCTDGYGSTEPGGASITMSESWAATFFAHVAVNIVQAVAGGAVDIGRTLRLFAGFHIKIFNGKLKIY